MTVYVNSNNAKGMKKAELPWRLYLTPDEARALAEIEAARSVWQELNKARPGITSRAIMRATYALKTGRQVEAAEQPRPEREKAARAAPAVKPPAAVAAQKPLRRKARAAWCGLKDK